MSTLAIKAAAESLSSLIVALSGARAGAAGEGVD